MEKNIIKTDVFPSGGIQQRTLESEGTLFVPTSH